MKARSYTLDPVYASERRILAVLATAKIMQGDDLEWGRLLFEDIRDRLPHGKRKRLDVSDALRRLVEAQYITPGPRRPGTGEGGAGLFQSYQITAIGMRVALGVLG